jgi:hypothetical protein
MRIAYGLPVFWHSLAFLNEMKKMERIIYFGVKNIM